MALTIGRRLRAAHDSVEALAVDPVEARSAEREGTRGKVGGGVPLSFHLTRQNLADMSGTTVETTIRIVGRWLKEGLLVDEGDRFILGDLNGLRALAEGEAS